MTLCQPFFFMEALIIANPYDRQQNEQNENQRNPIKATTVKKAHRFSSQPQVVVNSL
ncbi:hypothetical protein DES34_106328 [Brevibacillus brevis]|nr:hypothetical protein DES34_106328 [Brevibacillus brevis]VEF88141.1 Uncharacterised protein [Brevibacillus brevis]